MAHNSHTCHPVDRGNSQPRWIRSKKSYRSTGYTALWNFLDFQLGIVLNELHVGSPRNHTVVATLFYHVDSAPKQEDDTLAGAREMTSKGVEDQLLEQIR